GGPRPTAPPGFSASVCSPWSSPRRLALVPVALVPHHDAGLPDGHQVGTGSAALIAVPPSLLRQPRRDGTGRFEFVGELLQRRVRLRELVPEPHVLPLQDRKSTRLNSSHV